MNVYFGVTVNAARGIATQAGAAISQFVNSFTTALNPQITKSYAKGDTDYLLSLVCRGAKFSGFLFLIIAIPLVVEAPMIFKIWLKNVPDYAVLFFRINVLNILMDSVLVNSLMTSVFATGDIKKYQICVTAVGGMVFPLTWVAYALGATPEKTYIIYFLIYCVVLYVRLAIVRQKIGLFGNKGWGILQRCGSFLAHFLNNVSFRIAWALNRSGAYLRTLKHFG